MIIKHVFDTAVVVHHCNDKELFANESIKNSIEFVFSLEEVRETIDQSQIGNAFTTCNHFDKFPLTDMPGTEQLSEWVAKRILESGKHFGFENTSKVEFTRTWINLYFYGCEGTCHRHPTDIDGVAIFYPKVPAHSSELVFVRNGIDGTRINQYSNNDLIFQPVTQGDLVIHNPSIPHAISKHNNQDTRVCFIYEFKYH